MAHAILYRTRIMESSYSDEPFKGHYHDGFEGCCHDIEDAFENGFLTFEKSVDDIGLSLYKRNKKGGGEPHRCPRGLPRDHSLPVLRGKD